MTWLIPDWDKFEAYHRPDRSISDGPLQWMKIPTSQNMRYKRLMQEKNGIAYYGVWIGILGFWARQSRQTREGGQLKGIKSYATAEDIAAEIIAPKTLVREAIAKLIEIGWLQEMPCQGRGNDVAMTGETDRQIDRVKTELKTEKTDMLFERFYEAYPKRKARPNAEKAWAKLKPDAALLETMLSSLERWKQTPDWIKENGQYIPYPATWLNGRRWEDELPKDFQSWRRELSGEEIDEIMGWNHNKEQK